MKCENEVSNIKMACVWWACQISLNLVWRELWADRCTEVAWSTGGAFEWACFMSGVFP